MAINGINPTDPTYTSNVQPVKEPQANVATKGVDPTEQVQKTDAGKAVVYDKSNDSVKSQASKSSKPDMDKIQKMLQEAETKKQAFKEMIQKMFTKQGEQAVMATSNLADFYRNLEVTPEAKAQAQKDIADDGYWGVEQTSDRILSFAQAVAGTDKEMANKMLDAVKEGFKQAGQAWGEDLPDISQKTMSTTIDKINAWINGLE